MNATLRNHRRWRVVGFGRGGGAVTVHVHADTHADAVARAREFGVIAYRDCVLVEEPAR